MSVAAFDAAPSAPSMVGPLVAALAMSAFDAVRAMAGISRSALLAGVLLALWGAVLVQCLHATVRARRPPTGATLLAGTAVLPLTLVLATTPTLSGGIL